MHVGPEHPAHNALDWVYIWYDSTKKKKLLLQENQENMKGSLMR